MIAESKPYSMKEVRIKSAESLEDFTVFVFRADGFSGVRIAVKSRGHVKSFSYSYRTKVGKNLDDALSLICGDIKRKYLELECDMEYEKWEAQKNKQV